jgi:LysM repeat protein
MHPRTLRLMIAATALAGLALLFIPSLSLSQEDTAHLVLKKKIGSKDRPSVYIVQKGDSLSTIIRRKLGKPAAQSESVSRQVRKLNPQIRDVNRIYPGQKIALPQLAAEPGKAHYIVNKGDTLSQILHDRLGITRSDLVKWTALVKKLNPDLVSPDRIYAGQTLILPDKGSEAPVPVEQTASPAETDAAKIEAKIFRPTDRDLGIIAAVVKRAGGTLIRDGKYFIPLTEQEHLAVDCTDIPMVELPDGSRVFLDFGRQIPDETAALVRSRWGNFTVLSDGGNEGVFSVLAGIFAASQDYTFRRHEGYLEMGTTPLLKLRVDWILARKSSEGQQRYILGIFRTASRSQPAPEPIVRFAEKKGYPLLEIDEGNGSIRDRQALQPVSDTPALDPGGNRVLVGSLLDVLGYAYAKDQRIPLSDVSSEGGPLAIRTDYSVKIGTRTVIIHFGDLPTAFQVGLKEKGMGLVQISGDDERKTVVEKVLKGLDIPYVTETSEFRPPEDGSPPRWIIALGALRFTSDKGTLYLVPADADRDLCAFVRDRWNRHIVRY